MPRKPVLGEPQTARFELRMPVELKIRAAREAERRQMGLAALIKLALEKFLEDVEKTP